VIRSQFLFLANRFKTLFISCLACAAIFTVGNNQVSADEITHDAMLPAGAENWVKTAMQETTRPATEVGMPSTTSHAPSPVTRLEELTPMVTPKALPSGDLAQAGISHASAGETSKLEALESTLTLPGGIPAAAIADSNSVESGKVKTALVPPAGTVPILNESFEGTFPGAWIVFDNDDTANGEVFWSDTDYRSQVGSWSAGSASGGANASPPGSDYSNNMQSWMVWGPFSLSDAVGGSLEFKYWLDSEKDFDHFYWMASINGTSFSGYRVSGNSSGWQSGSLDFTNVGSLGNITGQPSVYIAFLFYSNGTNTAEGAYVDEVHVTKTTSDGGGDLDLQIIDAPAGTFAPGDPITIGNQTQNIGDATSDPYRITFYASTDTTISPSDYAIGYIDRTALAAGGIHSYNTNGNLPGGLPDGNYYIGAILTVTDANAGNNSNYDPTPITILTSGDPEIRIVPTSLNFSSALPAASQLAIDASLVDPLVNGNTSTASAPEKLFINVGPPETVGLPRQAVAAQAVTVNQRALRSPVISIELFGETVTALQKDVDIQQGQLIWVGHVEGQVMDTVIVTARGNTFSALIQHGGRTFELGIGRSGRNRLFELDLSLLPPDDPFVPPDGGGSVDGASDFEQPVAVNVVQDLLAVYTQSACDAVGSCDQMVANIVTAVADMNAAYQASGIDITMNLVGTTWTDYSGSDFNVTLDDLTGTNDGNMDEVHGVRDQLGADIVALVFGGDGAYCGLGWLNSNESHAFNVTAAECVVGNRSFAHEIGHNQGASHDRVTAGAGSSTDYNFGFRRCNDGSVDDRGSPYFRTIMAYNCNGSSRKGIYSNPEINYQGVPQGIDPLDEPTGGAHNARRLNERATTVADFRASANTESFTIFNDGSGELLVTAIDLESPAAWISYSPAEPFTVPAGGTRLVSVAVDFDSAPEGVSNNRLLVYSNDADENPYPNAVLINIDKAGTTCYALTLGHNGQGGDATAVPEQSDGCPAGMYLAGENVSLTAYPAAGWFVGSWTGTDFDVSTSLTNSLTMPGTDWSVMVNYVETVGVPEIRVEPNSLSFSSATAEAAQKTTGVVVEKADFSRLLGKIKTTGSLKIILGLDVPSRAEGLLNATQRASQRARINRAQDDFLARIGSVPGQARKFHSIPYIALEISADQLDRISRMNDVVHVQEDVPVRPILASSNAVIGSPAAWAQGYDGTGFAVAVLDTGVDKTHPFFSTGGNKVVSEACYSTTYGPFSSTSVCPGEVGSSTAPGSGAPCDTVLDSGCGHGTHVAGIAAGNDGVGPNYGVARGADIVAIQVFSQFDDVDICSPYSPPCFLSYTSDQISGLERVLELSATIEIASANMSLGGDYYTDQATCDSDNAAQKAAIDNLRSVGIATAAASGNDYYKNAMGGPGCISSAISVGSTTDADAISSFSNVAPFLDLLAPGSSITSSYPGGGTVTWDGTSMATPHVAGAWAVLKQKDPDAGVDTILAALRDTGTSVDDQRGGGSVTDMRRINVDAALGQISGGVVQTLTIFNDGSVDLLVTEINLESPAAWIKWSPVTPFTVSPGGSQMVDVEVDLDSAPEGLSSNRLLIYSDDADESPYPGAVIISVDRSKGEVIFSDSFE
jgi:subtilisin family serine protease